MTWQIFLLDCLCFLLIHISYLHVIYNYIHIKLSIIFITNIFCQFVSYIFILFMVNSENIYQSFPSWLY